MRWTETGTPSSSNADWSPSARIDGPKPQPQASASQSTTDKVFKYTLSGSLLGSWTIAGAGSSPTGITLDPAGGGTLWIVDSGTEALGAMRRMVGTLRGGVADIATTDLAADLMAAVERTRELGFETTLRIDLPDDVPPELGRSVLRLVQESLTNVHKHAQSPTLVQVDIGRTLAGAIRVVVTDDGTPHEQNRGGYGLVGMRERVELLGGLFSAGPRGGGWQVLAELPLKGQK